MGLKLPPGVLAKVLAQAVPVAGRGHAQSLELLSTEQPAQRLPRPLDSWALTVRAPGLVVVSEANRRDHWTARRKRARAQAEAVTLAVAACPRVPLPVRVRLVRVGGRALDPDNLAGGFKAVQDAVARWLGVDDGDADRVRWAYRQRPVRTGERRGVELRFRPLLE